MPGYIKNWSILIESLEIGNQLYELLTDLMLWQRQVKVQFLYVSDRNTKCFSLLHNEIVEKPLNEFISSTVCCFCVKFSVNNCCKQYCGVIVLWLKQDKSESS